MKADRCGTLTEQKMFKVGYLTSKERQAAGLFGKKCNTCRHMEFFCCSKRVRCSKHGFTTTINATCKEWEE